MSPSEVPTTTPGPVHLYFSVFQTKSRILNLASQVALVVKNLLASAGDVRDTSSICRSETLDVGDGQGA